MATEDGMSQVGGELHDLQPHIISSINEVFSIEELASVPESFRTKLETWSVEVTNNLKSSLFDKDSQISKLNGLLGDAEKQTQAVRDETKAATQKFDETAGKYSSAVTKLAEVEESVISHKKEVAELQLKSNMANWEKDEMVMLVNKRNDEIERLTESVKNLSDQLQTVTVAKIEALVKVDELTGKEMELSYKEKQLEREKDWVGKQVLLLNEELEKKNNEIMTIQREFSIKHLRLQTDLSEKNEQIRIAELTLSNMQKANEAQEKHIEHLINKLKDAEDIETKMQENYRQELTAQKKIANLYKESSDEATKKIDEFEDAVSSLQELLNNATSKYGELETKFINTAKTFQEEVAQREETINKIRKELENANKLIETFQNKGLTDEMIQSLSPAAAAATNMLKNTKSLTQIYSEYHDLQNELINKKQEVVQLNALMKELLQEIDTQRPELQTVRKENLANLEKIDILQNQLDLALRENEQTKVEYAHINKRHGGIERENSRLRTQLNDLAMQVRALLKETENQRGTYSSVVRHTTVSSGIAEVPDIESSAQHVVSERLVTFRNIEELQMQNQKLLAVVRELSETQEKATREAHETQLQAIKDSFQEAMRELEILREKRLIQDNLLQEAKKQRDQLTELLNQQRSPVKVADPGIVNKLTELQTQYEGLQVTYKSLQEEYDTYKKERSEHEKLAIEQTEKLRDDVMKMRTENSKLVSQVDYNNERTKIYNANLETYKKNITVLEERNKNYSATTLKLEQNLEMLRSEISATQQKLTRTEVALNSMTQERNSLRDTNSRLQAERDVLKREQNTQQMLRLNLQEIKNGLDLSNSAIKLKMESEIDNLQKENAILRRKVSTETERFKDAIFSWESTNKQLVEKLQQDQDSIQSTRTQLEDSKATIARLTGEIDDLQSQVKVLSNTTLESVNATEDQPVTIPGLERQIKELHAQLRDANIENESIVQHLIISRQSADEYRTLCASIESQISASSETSKQLTEELQQRLEGKDEIIRDIQSRLSIAERETATLKDEKENLSRELESKTLSLEEEINRMRRDLQAANTKLQSAYEENVRVKVDLEKQNMIYKDIQEKYEKELAAHVSDVNNLNDIKTELDSTRLKISEEEKLRRNAEEQLNQAVTDWTNKGNLMQNDITRLQETKEELETLNTSLQDQIMNLTTRIETSQKPEGDQSSSVHESESQKSSEQWLQLIRYLRREKEIAKTKTEMAESACSRLENQIQHMNKQTEDMKKELSELQDRSHVSIITSAKQADLLRKVETLSALTDSNRMLREEKDTAVSELTELKEKLSVLETDLGPLREKSSELEARCEGLLNENISLKQDVGRWRTRASALLEKSNKINPEELKRLQTENDTLIKQLQQVQEGSKKQQIDITRHLQQLKLLQQQTTALQASNQILQNEKKTIFDEQKKVVEERDKIRGDAQTLRLEVSNLKYVQIEKDEALTKSSKELENVNKLLEDQKNTVKAVKSIARKYKKQYEDLLKEQETGEKSGQLEAAMEGTSAGDSGVLSDVQKDEISRYEAQIKQLQDEAETHKRDVEGVRNERSQSEERMRNLIKNLREKLTTTNAQKAEIETQLNDFRSKLASLEVSGEESAVRFAALKSQYEGRLGRLEKENKDLKTTTGGNGSENLATVNLSLQQQNEDQKKELDMLRQRLVVVENRFKMQSQTSKAVSPEKVIPVEKAKANIRPIAGPSPKQATVARPPLTASIRPISMPRKATVSVSAMPTQNQQQQASSSNVMSSNVQSVSAVVAPVSQAQVSTSTPDQSSAAPESSPQQQIHQLPVNAGSSVPISGAGRQAAAIQPTVTVAPVAVGVSMVGGNNVAGVLPAGGVPGISSVQPQQGGGGTSTGNNETQSAHQDPSTSSATQILEESEMGDSSEQVSSSEGSTHQNILTVAPLRSKQHDAQQSSSSSSSSAVPHQPQPGPSKKQGSSSTEEPSPSSSSLRPTQSSNKRLRSEDTHHHDEEEDLLNEPDTKRTRIMGSIDREAEALGQESSNDQMIEEEEEEEEDDREADQGSSAVDDSQIQHSDTTTKETAGRTMRRRVGNDSDSDVIIIDSDDEEGRAAPKASTSRGTKAMAVEEEEVEDVEDEEEVDEEEQDEEELIEEEDDDDVDEDDDDQGDEGDKKMEVVYEDDDGQEGREAESLEHEDDDIREIDDGQEDSQDIMLDTNDPNLNAVDFSSQEQSNQQHELREAEQSIDDEGDEEREMVPQPIVIAPVSGGSMGSASGSPIRPPSRDLHINRLQTIGSPIRGIQVGRGGVPPLLGRQQQTFTPTLASAQYATEEVDDSIVPSTPTLFVPRRSDGFAEAVSSPQIQPGGRFTFGGVSAVDGSGSSSNTGTNASSSGSTGLEDTRVDFLGYDDGGGGNTGRSVPSTPLLVSPPVEVIEMSHEILEDEDIAQEEGVSVNVLDVQPTSSSVASGSGSDVPVITVTSAMDSSSTMVFQPPTEGTLKTTLEVTRLIPVGSQPRTTQSEVSSVTSSDEDKVPVAGASSSHAGAMQHPSTSTSSRAASPTPSSHSSAVPTEQKDPSPQPQQQQQQQIGRTRPTPIVWDQPSSSSSSNPISRPARGGMMGNRGAMAVRHMMQPDQGHIMLPMLRGYRPMPMMIMRGQNQSARRSRPHSRGGPSGGPGPSGTGGPGPGGNVGGRMPFQKPY